MKETLLTKGEDCCSREMTVVERLSLRRSNLIQELSSIEAAIRELQYRDLSNETAKVLTQIR